jgi:TRAP-type transport system small permease protein
VPSTSDPNEVPDPDAAASASASGEARAAAAPTVNELQQQYGGRFTRGLARVNAVLHVVAGATMVGLLFWTVGDIIGRAFFSRPFRGTVELTELAVVMLVYLGLARAENQDGHIAVDLLYVRLGPRTQLALRAFAGLVSFSIISVMTWRLYLFAGQLDVGNYTTGVLRLPLYPVAVLGVIGATAFALAVLANLYVALRALATGR